MRKTRARWSLSAQLALGDLDEASEHLVALPLARRLDPRKYIMVDLGGGMMMAVRLVTGRDLANRYERAEVVTLVSWFDEPILAAGDAEAVFLTAA